MQSYIAQDILEMLDSWSLANAEQVSQLWREIIVDNKLWKKMFDSTVCMRLMFHLQSIISSIKFLLIKPFLLLIPDSYWFLGE